MKKILFISMFSCFLTCTEVQASIANSTSSNSQFKQISTNLSNEEFGKHIGKLINAILFTYDPQAIILGGGLSAGYQLFSEKMFDVITTFPYPETIKRMKILLSRKEDIYLLGAAALVV